MWVYEWRSMCCVSDVSSSDLPVLNRAKIARFGNLVGEDIAVGGQLAAVGLLSGLAGDFLGALHVRIFVADGIHADLAQPRCHGANLRLSPVGKVLARLETPFDPLLARDIEVGLNGKDRRTLDDCVARAVRQRVGGGTGV